MTDFKDGDKYDKYEIGSAERMIGACIQRNLAAGRIIVEQPIGLTYSIKTILELKESESSLDHHVSPVLKEEGDQLPSFRKR